VSPSEMPTSAREVMRAMTLLSFPALAIRS
jgi:hypothetical protein